MLERLQKIIAQAGIASRRHAEELIRSGQVRVNGELVTELGSKADPEKDRVEVAGRVAEIPDELVYIILHKPPEVVSTMADPEGRKTIRHFLRGTPERVFPVGRLDYAASGLMLLTSDGQLAARVLRASSRLKQTYWIKVKGRISETEMHDAGRAAQAHFAPLKGPWARRSAENPWYEVELTGASRDALGHALKRQDHPIEKMKRVQLGTLELGNVPEGHYRKLEPAEVEKFSRAIDRALAGPSDDRSIAQSNTRTQPAAQDGATIAPQPPAGFRDRPLFAKSASRPQFAASANHPKFPPPTNRPQFAAPTKPPRFSPSTDRPKFEPPRQHTHGASYRRPSQPKENWRDRNDGPPRGNKFGRPPGAPNNRPPGTMNARPPGRPNDQWRDNKTAGAPSGPWRGNKTGGAPSGGAWRGNKSGGAPSGGAWRGNKAGGAPSGPWRGNKTGGAPNGGAWRGNKAGGAPSSGAWRGNKTGGAPSGPWRGNKTGGAPSGGPWRGNKPGGTPSGGPWRGNKSGGAPSSGPWRGNKSGAPPRSQNRPPASRPTNSTRTPYPRNSPPPRTGGTDRTRRAPQRPPRDKPRRP